MANHRDPVCGMPMEEKDAAGVSEHNGVTYYFDSEECMSKFNQRPEQYVHTSDKQKPTRKLPRQVDSLKS